MATLPRKGPEFYEAVGYLTFEISRLYAKVVHPDSIVTMELFSVSDSGVGFVLAYKYTVVFGVRDKDRNGILRTLEFEIGKDAYDKATYTLNRGKTMNAASAEDTDGQAEMSSPDLSNITLKKIPPRIGVTSSVDWYALHCTCSDTYFCRHIQVAYDYGGDLLHWVPVVNRLTSMKICVPIFMHVLFPFLVEIHEIPDWEGNISKKLLIQFGQEGHERFFDYPPPSGLGDRYEALHQCLGREIIQKESDFCSDPANEQFFNRVTGSLDSSGPILCSNALHNYGSTSKFLEWLRKARNEHNLSKCVSATSFTYVAYGMCYICYQNSMPAFSLINL